MTTKSLVKKIEELEKEIKEIKMPKKVLAKVFVDEKTLEKSKKALFNSPKIEMHDRIIIATAMFFNANLISKNKEIKGIYSKTIW